MIIELSSNKSDLAILVYDTLQCEQWCYTHPNYWLANEDKIIGHLFKDYEKAFTTFTIYYN